MSYHVPFKQPLQKFVSRTEQLEICKSLSIGASQLHLAWAFQEAIATVGPRVASKTCIPFGITFPLIEKMFPFQK